MLIAYFHDAESQKKNIDCGGLKNIKKKSNDLSLDHLMFVI